jgi:hypothetical protein
MANGLSLELILVLEAMCLELFPCFPLRFWDRSCRRKKIISKCLLALYPSLLEAGEIPIHPTKIAIKGRGSF